MTDTATKNEEKKVEHKVGEYIYAQRGISVGHYVIIGAPRVKGVRWVTIASIYGGGIASYPEDIFDQQYWIVGENNN